MTEEQTATSTGSDVSTFLKNTINQIKSGVGEAGGYISGLLEFELEITERKETEGSVGFKQFIKIGGKKEGESVQRVKFRVDPPDYKKQ